MHILGPFTKSAKGNQYILVIIDRFTKFWQAVPMNSTTATAVAQAFVENVYPYGIPFYLLTDNGREFVSNFFGAVCSMLCIKHLIAMAYQPQTNGPAERFNKTLVERLRHYVVEHQTG